MIKFCIGLRGREQKKLSAVFGELMVWDGFSGLSHSVFHFSSCLPSAFSM
jgi:hypothetical protein